MMSVTSVLFLLKLSYGSARVKSSPSVARALSPGLVGGDAGDMVPGRSWPSGNRLCAFHGLRGFPEPQDI